MTVTRRRSPRRRALAVSAALGLLLSSITVLSTPALGDSPSEECASADPEWNGDFWKIEEEDGILGEIETNIAGAISLATDGSWTNTNEDPVFRVVLKIDDADDQVLTGLWETGEGGLIDTTLDGLEHVTFCSTSEVVVDAVPTTTTIPTTTTSAEQTTTTSAGPTTTTSPGPTSTTPAEPTTTTSQGASTADTPFPDEPAPNAPAQPASEGAQAVESDEEAAGASSDSNEANGPKSSPADSDRDTTVGGLTDERSGDPPALGQASMPNAEIDSNPSSQHWLALQDLAILSALIAGIGVLILIDRGKLDFRRLLKNSHVGKRWR